MPAHWLWITNGIYHNPARGETQEINYKSQFFYICEIPVWNLKSFPHVLGTHLTYLLTFLPLLCAPVEACSQQPAQSRSFSLSRLHCKVIQLATPSTIDSLAALTPAPLSREQRSWFMCLRSILIFNPSIILLFITVLMNINSAIRIFRRNSKTASGESSLEYDYLTIMRFLRQVAR